MKLDSKNIGLVVVLVAISIGATYALTSELSFESFGAPSSASGAFMTGHVEAVVTDKNGNVIAYRQADNDIVINGMSIIASQVFRADATTFGNHTNITSGPVSWMNIGNNTGQVAPDATNAGLACALENADIATCGTGAEGQEDSRRPLCIGELAEMRIRDARANPAGDAQVNVTAIATFDGADCNSIAIQEAGMWNNATAPPTDNGELFARNTFGAVTLTTTDSLELTWRFTFTDN